MHSIRFILLDRAPAHHNKHFLLFEIKSLIQNTFRFQSRLHIRLDSGQHALRQASVAYSLPGLVDVPHNHLPLCDARLCHWAVLLHVLREDHPGHGRDAYDETERLLHGEALDGAPRLEVLRDTEVRFDILLVRHLELRTHTKGKLKTGTKQRK